MLIYRTKNFQLFGFRPQRSHGKNSAYGFHIRCRKKKIWTHFTLRLHQRSGPLPGAKGAYTYEIISWKTSGGVSDKKRITWKKFIRLKIGRGGNKIE